MAEKSREQELARAAEELHGATTDLLKLREVLEQFPDAVISALAAASGESPSEEVLRRQGFEFGFREQPEPREPFLSDSGDPTLAERFEDELNGVQ